MLQTIQSGSVPLTIDSHEAVARHYNIPTVNLAAEVAERIRAGRLTWGRYGGVHPGRPGNELCAQMIENLLTQAWKNPMNADSRPVKHGLPATPLDNNHYGTGRFISPSKSSYGVDWKFQVPEWQKIPGQWRERFRSIPMLVATKAGAELTFPFEGRAIGIYVLAGPDAGIVEYTIDQGPARKADLFHAFSRGLHYPRTVMLDADLQPGPHRLKLRIVPEHNPASVGTAVRIMQFECN